MDYTENKEIIIGKTKLGAVITVCNNCMCYSIPHFNYDDGKRQVTLSLLSAEYVDTFENIELKQRTDLEEFLNNFVTIKDIQKLKGLVKKENKKFFKMDKKQTRKYPDLFKKYEGKEKYTRPNVEDLEADMTYWNLIVKLWNKYNEEKTPKNLLKPYYRNFIEYVDVAVFAGAKDLNGAMLYTKQDQERTPHFIYRTADGEEIGILYEKAEYLEPKPRALTKEEIENLIQVLSRKYKTGTRETHWQAGVWLWNEQNYEYNNYAPSWFPKYKKLDENIKMPDYTKLYC